LRDKQEDATSPTVLNTSVFITAAINLRQARDALTKDEVGKLLKIPLAERRLLIDHERYHPHMTHDKKQVSIVYVKKQSSLWAAKIGVGLLPQTLR
jgi:hypothetical protein